MSINFLVADNLTITIYYLIMLRKTIFLLVVTLLFYFGKKLLESLVKFSGFVYGMRLI